MQGTRNNPSTILNLRDFYYVMPCTSISPKIFLAGQKRFWQSMIDYPETRQKPAEAGIRINPLLTDQKTNSLKVR